MERARVTYQAVTPNQLDRLWRECRDSGIGEEGRPRHSLQTVPFLPDNPVEQTRLYMLESLFTGLNTDEPDTMLRAYVQAHGYIAALSAYGKHQSAYYQDLLYNLRDRVETHFLRGG